MVEESAYKTWLNQTYLESMGLNPLPVWHIGEPMSYLDEYCENYDYVAIGGAASGSMSASTYVKMWKWVSNKYPKTKFHLFGIGVSGTDIFKVALPYSSDFSTWTVPARFGHTVVLDNKKIIREIRPSDEERKKMKSKKGAMEEMGRIIERIEYFRNHMEEFDFTTSYQPPIFQI